MNDARINTKKLIVILLILVLITSLILSLYTSKKQKEEFKRLQQEQEEEQKKQEEAEKAKKIEIPTKVFTSDEIGFSMEVPEDWTYVKKSGCDNFINQADGSRIVFLVSDYNASCNKVTKEDQQKNIASAGGAFGSFSRDDNTSYFLTYEILDTDYMEYYTWDRDTKISILCELPAEKYADYYKDIMNMIKTFQWEKPNPFPDSCEIYYSAYGNFEFPIPETWAYSIVDGRLIAKDAATDRNVKVFASKNTDSLNAVTADVCYDTLSAGKEHFKILTINNTGSLIHAESTYQIGNTAFTQYYTVLANGKYWYEVEYNVPDGVEDDGYYNILNKYFRVF